MLMSRASFFQFADVFQPSPGVADFPPKPVPGETAEQMLSTNSTALDRVFDNTALSPIAKANPIASRLAKAMRAVCLCVFKAPGT